MTVAAHSAEQLRLLAWYGLSAVALYFVLASLALRWRPRASVRVTSYEPPRGVSPAVGAYLLERGVGDKPFVVAIVNMAAKGYLKIEQGPCDYLISQVSASVPLETEEEIIANALFRRDSPSALLSNLFALEKTARNVHNSLESAAEPDLISPHFPFLVPALTVSFWCFLAALYPEMQSLWDANFSALLILPAFLAVWSLLATLRTLPATFYKIKSRFPGRTPHPLRFVKADRTSPVMFLVALASMAVMGWASSWQLAALFGSYIAVNLVGSMALRAPTSAGHALLHQLADFRMFFAAVDSDRVNRVNAPNAPSPATEKYWAWALALDVEHAWGEQFAAAVLNRLGPKSAMTSIENNLPEEARASQEILDLHLR
jgi:hypothetical protein